jgi:hypothetical protein
MMRKALIVSLFLISGCFKYVPLTEGYEQIEKGNRLRTEFIEAESFQLSDITVHNIIALDGEYVRQDNSDLILSAFWLDSSLREVGFPGDGWSVRIPISNISRLEVKELDWWRTTAVVLGVFLGTYLGWEATNSSPGSGDNPGDGGSIIR